MSKWLCKDHGYIHALYTQPQGSTTGIRAVCWIVFAVVVIAVSWGVL